MSTIGFRAIYRYFCNDCDKWNTAETAEDSPPKECTVNSKHQIREGSVSHSGRLTVLKPIIHTYHFDTCDMSDITFENYIIKLDELARRVKVLEKILQNVGQIKFV